MKIANFIRTMDDLDAKGIWACRSATLKMVFREKPSTLLKGLAAMERAGLLVKISRGLYVNPRAKSLPPTPVLSLVSFLRPWHLSYLSLESVLSEAGMISQLPSRMTFMTTGREGEFFTPYGTIEFVHTKRDRDAILRDVTYDTYREIHVATPAQALRDLRRVGRNMHLIEEHDHVHQQK